MRGRKVIPINIKKVKGTHRPHRDRDIPEPLKEKPHAPSHLNKRAKQIFRLLVKRLSVYNLDSRTFTEAIALGAEAAESDERNGKILREQGSLYATINAQGQKVVKVRPEVRLQSEARKEYWKFLIEFGLTGTSAQKMGTPKKKDNKNEFEGF